MFCLKSLPVTVDLYIHNSRYIVTVLLPESLVFEYVWIQYVSLPNWSSSRKTLYKNYKRRTCLRPVSAQRTSSVSGVFCFLRICIYIISLLKSRKAIFWFYAPTKQHRFCVWEKLINIKQRQTWAGYSSRGTSSNLFSKVAVFKLFYRLTQ